MPEEIVVPGQFDGESSSKVARGSNANAKPDQIPATY